MAKTSRKKLRRVLTKILLESQSGGWTVVSRDPSAKARPSEGKISLASASDKIANYKLTTDHEQYGKVTLLVREIEATSNGGIRITGDAKGSKMGISKTKRGALDGVVPPRKLQKVITKFLNDKEKFTIAIDEYQIDFEKA